MDVVYMGRVMLVFLLVSICFYLLIQREAGFPSRAKGRVD